MSEYDGEIRIKASIDADEVDKRLQKLTNKLERQTESLERQRTRVEKLRLQYQDLINGVTQTKEELGITKAIERTKKKLEELRDAFEYEQFAFEAALADGKNTDGILKVTDKYKALENELKKLQKELEKIKLDPKSAKSVEILGKEIDLSIKKEQRLNSEIGQTELALAKLGNQKTNNFTKKIDEARNAICKIGRDSDEAGKKSKGIFTNMGEATSGFGARIMRLASAAFVFNIISAGFRKIREHVGILIAQDNQLMSSLNQVKANLLTAFMPIWQAILPALQALGRALAWVTSHIAAFISMLFGKSVQQSQAAAKSYVATSAALRKQAKSYDKVGRSAKKAAGELASFDKIEVLRKKDSESDTGGGNLGGGAEVPKILGGFKDINTGMLDKIKESFERLKKLFENWDLASLGKWTTSEFLPHWLNLLSNSLEAFEPIFDQVGDDLKWLWNDFLKPASKWVGDNIIKFIDRMAEGVKKWGENIKKNQLALDIFSAFIIGLGTSTALVTLAMGIWGLVSATWAWTAALLANPITWIVAGIAALIAIIIMCVKHWDEIREASVNAWEKMKQTWDNVGKWFDERVGQPLRNLWNGVTSAWKGAINSMISMFENFVNRIINGINLLTGTLNKIGFDIPDWLGGGHFGINIPKIPNISLPRLAQGAVLEGGNPFLAWVNDQPRGQTNIETPLNTMIQAFKSAISEMPQNERPIVFEAKGDFAPFIRWLNVQLKKENARVGQSFATGDSWI